MAVDDQLNLTMSSCQCEVLMSRISTWTTASHKGGRESGVMHTTLCYTLMSYL
jgi:hypothetical protein